MILNISQSYLYDDTTDLYYATDISLQIDTEAALNDSGAFILPSLALPKLGRCRCYLSARLMLTIMTLQSLTMMT